MSDRTESALEFLCWQSEKLLILVALSLIGVGLTFISLFVYDLSPKTEVIAYLNLVGLFGLIAINGSILLKCHQR